MALYDCGDPECMPCKVQFRGNKTMRKTHNCELCGEPMPEGETMFKYHGSSGPCPKPRLPRPAPIDWQARAAEAEKALREFGHHDETCESERRFDEDERRMKPGCTCGLDDALAKARGAPTKGE